MDESVTDRVARARELLEGTGLVLARDVGTWKARPDGTYTDAAKGWNACRAAMLDPDFVGDV